MAIDGGVGATRAAGGAGAPLRRLLGDDFRDIGSFVEVEQPILERRAGNDETPGQAGLTLVEVLASLMISMICVIAFLQLTLSSRASLGVDRDRAEGNPREQRHRAERTPALERPGSRPVP